MVPLSLLSTNFPRACHKDALIVDALFGTGLSRPLEGLAACLAGAINQAKSPVLAVDIPSGLQSDHGQEQGICVQADVTLSFYCLKPVHILQPARQKCGEICLGSLGFSPDIEQKTEVYAYENAPALWEEFFPKPGVMTHKHQRGRLAVITGGASTTGAARLAARAGLRSGAGLVTLLTPPSALLIATATSTAVMTRSFRSVEDLLEQVNTLRADAVLYGPGARREYRNEQTQNFSVQDRGEVGNAAVRHHVLGLLESRAGLVLDADALTAFASQPSSLFQALRTDDVLTPHQGEFERLFPGLLQASRNKIEAVRHAAAKAGAVLVLKGADTVIAHPKGEVIVNTHATPFLATAGSGDVLAGMLAGLMAQGMPAFAAAGAAVWLHGEAGLCLGPGLIAEDLVEILPKCFFSLLETI